MQVYLLPTIYAPQAGSPFGILVLVTVTVLVLLTVVVFTVVLVMVRVGVGSREMLVLKITDVDVGRVIVPSSVTVLRISLVKVIPGGVDVVAIVRVESFVIVMVEDSRTVVAVIIFREVVVVVNDSTGKVLSSVLVVVLVVSELMVSGGSVEVIVLTTEMTVDLSVVVVPFREVVDTEVPSRVVNSVAVETGKVEVLGMSLVLETVLVYVDPGTTIVLYLNEV